MKPISRIVSPQQTGPEGLIAIERIGVAFESPEEVLEYARIYERTGGPQLGYERLLIDADRMSLTGEEISRKGAQAQHVVSTLEKAAATPLNRWQLVGKHVFKCLAYEPYQVTAKRLLHGLTESEEVN